MKKLFQFLILLVSGLQCTAPVEASTTSPDYLELGMVIRLGDYPVNQTAYVPTTTDVLNLQPLQISFSLNTSISQVHVGDSFDIDVVVHDLFAGDAADELLAFGLNAISSDSSLLHLTGSTINPLFSADSVFLGLDAAGSAFPGIGNDLSVAQVFSLATLHFQALAAGNVSLTIASDLVDFNQGLFFLNQGQLAINATQSLAIAAVPLPPTVLLFISGLIMSAGGFRKRIG